MPTLTKNYGLKGGTLDGSKHVRLAADPAAYLRKLAEKPWARALHTTDADARIPASHRQSC